MPDEPNGSFQITFRFHRQRHRPRSTNKKSRRGTNLAACKMRLIDSVYRSSLPISGLRRIAMIELDNVSPTQFSMLYRPDSVAEPVRSRSVSPSHYCSQRTFSTSEFTGAASYDLLIVPRPVRDRRLSATSPSLVSPFAHCSRTGEPGKGSCRGEKESQRYRLCGNSPHFL